MYILVWRAILFMIYKSTCNLYHFILSKCIVYLAHKCMLKPFESSFNAINKVIFYTLQIISLTFYFNFVWYSEFFWRTWTLNFMKRIQIILWLSSFYSPSRNNLRRRALFPFTAAACKGVGNAPKIKNMK